MASSLVQALVANGGSPVTSLATAFGSNVTAGSRIIVATYVGAAVAHTDGMVTDTLSNSYTKDFEFASAAGDLCFYSAPSPSGGACTVTYNPATNTRLGMVIMETASVDAYVATQTSSNNATSANLATGAITPTNGNGICMAAFYQNNALSSWETDYNTGSVYNSTGRIGGAYKVITSTSSEEATGTFGGSVPWYAMLIRYPETAAGGVVGPLMGGHLTGGGILWGRLA